MLQDVKLPSFAENRAFFSGQGLVTYQSIYKTAQGIWRKIGKINEVFEPYQTVDTRVLDGAAEYFPQAGEAQPSSSSRPAQDRRRADPDQDRLHLLPHRVLDPGRERQVRAGFAGGGSGRHLRQRLPAHLGNTDNVGSRESNLRLSRLGPTRWPSS